MSLNQQCHAITSSKTQCIRKCSDNIEFLCTQHYNMILRGEEVNTIDGVEELGVVTNSSPVNISDNTPVYLPFSKTPSNSPVLNSPIRVIAPAGSVVEFKNGSLTNPPIIKNNGMRFTSPKISNISMSTESEKKSLSNFVNNVGVNNAVSPNSNFVNVNAVSSNSTSDFMGLYKSNLSVTGISPAYVFAATSLNSDQMHYLYENMFNMDPVEIMNYIDDNLS